MYCVQDKYLIQAIQQSRPESFGYGGRGPKNQISPSDESQDICWLRCWSAARVAAPISGDVWVVGSGSVGRCILKGEKGIGNVKGKGGGR